MASSYSRSRFRPLMTCHVIKGKEWKARRIKNRTLRGHCRTLGKTFQKTDVEEAEQLRKPCLRLCRRLEEDTEMFTATVPGGRELVRILLRLAAYQDCWIRTPESWVINYDHDPASQFCDLRRHLLGKYEVPALYESAWYANGLLRHQERDWYCHVIQGGSLRSAPGMFASVSRRAIHLMNDAPDFFSLRLAMRFGQLRALEMTPPLLGHLLRSEVARDLEHDEVWLPFFMMLRDAGDLVLEDVDLIIHHLRDEIRSFGSIRLKGRSLADLMRSAQRGLIAHLKVARKAGYDFTEEDLGDRVVRSKLLHLASGWWKALPDVAPFCYRGRSEEWKVEELCTQVDLRKEAEALRHCVSTYGPSCRAGKSAIFSLRRRWDESAKWESLATLEVEPTGRSIVQAQGDWNDPLSERERQIVSRWACENDIRVPAFWRIEEKVDRV